MIYNSAYASTTKPIRLKEAIKIALKENLNIKIAKNIRKKSLLSNKINTIHLWAPKANFLVSQDNHWGKKNTHLLQSNPIFNLSWDLQSVFNKLFKFKKQNHENKIYVLTSTKSIEKELQKVVTCHYELALAQKKGELFNTFIRIAYTKLKIEEERLKLGFSSKIDCLNADLVLKKSKLTLLEHQETLKEKRRNFNLILGKSLNEETLVESNISFKPVWNITAVTKEKVVNLKTAIQEKKVAIAKNELTKVKLYPISCLSLLGEIQSNGYTYDLKDSTWRNHPSKAGLRIWISLDIGRLLIMPSKIRKSRMELDSEVLNLNKEKLAAEGKLENKKWKYRHMLGLYKLVKEQMKVSNEKLLLVKENYKMNQLKLLDLQEAEEEVQKAEINLIEYAFKVKQAEFDLYRLIGNVHEQVEEQNEK
ncbi:TolC family protein [Candidatus Cardinium hertigii]|uniref:TolC family protein n=1 Tax=Candidatus Cardinium hertigii TaxID=247481 RepID=UPI003D7E81B1